MQNRRGCEITKVRTAQSHFDGPRASPAGTQIATRMRTSQWKDAIPLRGQSSTHACVPVPRLPLFRSKWLPDSSHIITAEFCESIRIRLLVRENRDRPTRRAPILTSPDVRDPNIHTPQNHTLSHVSSSNTLLTTCLPFYLLQNANQLHSEERQEISPFGAQKC